MSVEMARVAGSWAGRRGMLATVASMVALTAAVIVAPGSTGRIGERSAEAHVNRTLPDVTHRAPGLHFSETPADEEFLRTGLFVQPLVPTGRTSGGDNRELAKALLAYDTASRRGEVDAVQPILAFLGAHPDSAWAPALEVDLGAIYRRTGHYSKALTVWQKAWSDSKDLRDANGRAIGDAAAAYLSQFEAYLGRKETLQPLLQEVKARPIHGSAAELVSESKQGLMDMLQRPEVSFKCGPSALARILKEQPTESLAKSRATLTEARSTPNGLSLLAVQQLSSDAGMSYQMAYRSPGAPVVAPAVAHWKMGHYAALIGKDPAGRLLIGDATFGEDITMTLATLDEEASGYFLVPGGPLPDGWRSVDPIEGNAVWGRGNTGNNHDNGATGAGEKHAFSCPKGGGCSMWNVEAMVDGLSLHDDPLGYTPPFGPRITFPMDYSHRDMQQPQTFPYTNFGNKWTSGWLSYINWDSPCDGFYGSQVLNVNVPGGAVVGADPMGTCALLYRRGGGSEPYFITALAPPSPGPYPHSIQVSSALGQFNESVVTRIYDANTLENIAFWRTLPDGGIEKFELLMGRAQYFMTELDDAQGNAVKISYDQETMRIVALTDAVGQVTTFCYSDSWQTSPALCRQPPANVAPPTTLEVTQVTDPFGRSAYFGYDPTSIDDGGTGHLTSITDVLGITSEFTYAPGSDFISALTTPYGITTFAFTDPNTDESVPTYTRSVTVTDPLGRISRVEFRQGGPTPSCLAKNAIPPAAKADDDLITCQEIAAPQGMATSNENLQYRNTFIWDPYQYQAAFGSPTNNGASGPPYPFASIIHWLHANQDSDTNPLTASRVPESTKEPFDSRVWLAYANQDRNVFRSSAMVGSTNQPTAVGRVLDDGSTQLWQYTYNAYGKVLSVTDPAKRQVSFEYAMNGIDLLNVKNTSAGTVDLLATFADYNNQHEPETRTATSGQTTHFAYDAAGQPIAVTDPLGHTWTYEYDLPSSFPVRLGAPCTAPRCGYLKTVTGPTVASPTGPQTPVYSFTYDTLGRPLSSTDPVRGTLTYQFDAADRPTSVLFPDGTSESFAYALLDLKSATDRRGAIVSRQYDNDRELLEIDEPDARSTVLTYLPNGLVQTVQDPRQFVTQYVHDIDKRLTGITYPNGDTQAYTYDAARRLLTAARSASVVTYTYNVDDTLAEVDPSGESESPPVAPTFFAYDARYRRLTRWAQAADDPATHPGVTVRSQELFSYYAATQGLGANLLSGDTVATTDSLSPGPTFAGSRTLYTYDELDRVSTRSLGSNGLAFGETFTETYTYDAIGRLTRDANALDTFSYAYADATGRPQRRTSGAGPVVTATYYPQERDGLLETLGYSTAEGSPLTEFGYEYDPDHNVHQFTETYAGETRTSTYAYDDREQLLQASATGSQPESTTYGYDVSGNIQSQVTSAPLFGVGPEVPVSTRQTQYDAWNEIATTTTRGRFGPPTTTRPIYDSKGNLTFLDGTTTFVYDSLNRLTAVNRGTTNTSYFYDGLGRMVQAVDKEGSSVRSNRSFHWCGNDRCAAFDNTHVSQLGNDGVASLDKVYFNQGAISAPFSIGFGAGGGRRPLQASNGAYYVTDALGSVRELVGAPSRFPPHQTPLLARYQYDAYGNASKLAGAADSDFGFGGYFQDQASGLEFAMNRVYDPEIGRWLTPDPIGNGIAFAGGLDFNASDFNVYAYAGNNPTTQRDPSGNCPQCIVAGAVIGGVGNAIYYASTAPTNLTWGQFLAGAGMAAGQGAVAGAAGALLAVVAVEAPPLALGLLEAGGGAY